MMTKQISNRDWERLSAYLDQQLSPKEIAALEMRLQTGSILQEALQELQISRNALKQLPLLKAPRNFTLTPQMVGIQKPITLRWYPVLRFASVLTSILFVVIVVGDLLNVGTSMSRQEIVAPALAPAGEIMVEESVELDIVSDDELSAPESELQASESEPDAALESLAAEKSTGNLSDEPAVGFAEPAPLVEEADLQEPELSPTVSLASEPAPLAEESDFQEPEMSPTMPDAAESAPIIEELETQERDSSATDSTVIEEPTLFEGSDSQASEIIPEAPSEQLAEGENLSEYSNLSREEQSTPTAYQFSSNFWLPIVEIVLGLIAVGTTIIAIYLRKRES